MPRGNAEMLSRQNILTGEIIPSLVEMTPGGGTYANEADYREKNWQEEFYGATWDELNRSQA